MVSIKFQILIIDSQRRLDTEPVLNGVFHVPSFLSQLIKFSQNRTSQHVFDQDLACSLWVKEKEEFSDCCNDVEWIEVVLKILKLRKSWHKFENVILKIFLLEVPIASRVVQGNLNSGLEQVDLPHDVVEERHDFNSPVLVSFELQESRAREELTALWRQVA